MSLFPVLDLLFGFLFCDSVFLLNLAKEDFASAGDLVDFIIGQFVPLHLHRTTELLPVTLYLIPVHFFLLSIDFGQMQATRDRLPVADTVRPGKDHGRLFHDQVILYGLDPFDALSDLHRFINGFLRINGAAQLNVALDGFDTDLE